MLKLAVNYSTLQPTFPFTVSSMSMGLTNSSSQRSLVLWSHFLACVARRKERKEGSLVQCKCYECGMKIYYVVGVEDHEESIVKLKQVSIYVQCFHMHGEQLHLAQSNRSSSNNINQTCCMQAALVCYNSDAPENCLQEPTLSSCVFCTTIIGASSSMLNLLFVRIFWCSLFTDIFSYGFRTGNLCVHWWIKRN